MLKIRNRVTDDHDAVKQIMDLHTQLADLEKRLKTEPSAKDLVADAEQLDKNITAVEEELMQTKSKSSEDALNYPIRLDDKLMALGSTVESADAAPTRQSYEVFDLLSGQLDAQLAKWKSLQAADLADLNKRLRKENVENIMILPVERQ